MVLVAFAVLSRVDLSGARLRQTAFAFDAAPLERVEERIIGLVHGTPAGVEGFTSPIGRKPAAVISVPVSMGIAVTS